jgi:hypothetical protein
MTDVDALFKQITENKELFDVVTRHGLTEKDLLSAFRSLRELGRPAHDLWAVVAYAARMKGSTGP